MRLLSLTNLLVFIFILILHGTAIQGQDESETSNVATPTDDYKVQIPPTNVGFNPNSGRIRNRGRYKLG